MQTVKVKMNAGDLKGIIDLPDYPDDQRVTITVNPEVKEKSVNTEELKKILKELAGCLSNSPDKYKSRDEIRYERIMSKYESLN